MASANVALAAAQPLTVASVRKRFGELTALDGLSLELRTGECLGLLGPNGSGKSTLIRAMMGRVKTDEGRILVFGQPAGSAEARAALGWIPQELALYPRLSCRENLIAFGRFHGLQKDALKSAVERCLRWATLEDRARDLVGNLSGGMKRRLNMAAGLLHQPRIVLMDEPTVGVDPQSRNHIYEMIESLRSQGTAILYTTHYMEEAEKLCDRLVIMDNGSFLCEGRPSDLVAEHIGKEVVEFACDDKDKTYFINLVKGKYDYQVIRNRFHLFIKENQNGKEAVASIHSNDVTIRKATLEDVFLKVAGHELKEGE